MSGIHNGKALVCRAQVFCKDLNKLQSGFFERLMPTATVSGGAVYTMPQDIITNHLVIRGSFQVCTSPTVVSNNVIINIPVV